MRATFGQLETFLIVHEAGSFAAAARRLDVSEAAVGKQMAALERAVDGPVFDRHSGAAVRLNARGRLLLDRAPELVDKARQLDRELRPDAVTVRVGVDNVLLGTVFYPNMGAFYRAYSDIQIEFVEREPSLESVAAMSAERLDLLYMTLVEPVPAESGENLARSRGCLYISPRSYAAQGWRNDSKRPLPLILSSGPMLERNMRKTLQRAGITNYRVAARVPHGDAMRALAVEGIGACMLAESRAAPFVRAQQLVRIFEPLSADLARYVFRSPTTRSQKAHTVERYLSSLVRARGAAW